MAHQGDGTSEARSMSQEDRAWLEGALKSAMIDLSKRMEDIKQSLDSSSGGAAAPGGGGPGAEDAAASLEQQERMLDELQDIVESIDLARGEAWARGGARGGARPGRLGRQPLDTRAS